MNGLKALVWTNCLEVTDAQTLKYTSVCLIEHKIELQTFEEASTFIRYK